MQQCQKSNTCESLCTTASSSLSLSHTPSQQCVDSASAVWSSAAVQQCSSETDALELRHNENAPFTADEQNEADEVQIRTRMCSASVHSTENSTHCSTVQQTSADT